MSKLVFLVIPFVPAAWAAWRTWIAPRRSPDDRYPQTIGQALERQAEQCEPPAERTVYQPYSYPPYKHGVG